MRTFKQLGQGYSNAAATVIVKIDGETVYMGPVPTINEPVPTDFGWCKDHLVTLWQWQKPLPHRAAQTVEVTVTSGRVLLLHLVSDNTDIPGASATWNISERLVDHFGPFHPGDCWSNVKINGRPQALTSGKPGDSYWLLHNGDVLTGNINMDLPLPA
jgi:hypothetical protein